MLSFGYLRRPQKKALKSKLNAPALHIPSDNTAAIRQSLCTIFQTILQDGRLLASDTPGNEIKGRMERRDKTIQTKPKAVNVFKKAVASVTNGSGEFA